MGFFSSLLTSPMKKRIKKYVEYLEVSSDEELGLHLALGTVIRKGMINDNNSISHLIGGETPCNYTQGNEYISDAIAYIFAFPTAKGLQDSANNGNQVASSLLTGFAVWKMTLYCLSAKPKEQIDTDYFVLGRQMWKELKRGMPYVENALNSIDTKISQDGFIDVDDWMYSNCKYIPEMFDVENSKED